MSHGIFLLQMANRLKLLHKLYTDENSPVFLTKNIDYLLKFTKKHPQLRELTKSEILAYTNSLSDISRDREKRILRGRKRYLSHRRWIVHAPCNISKFFLVTCTRLYMTVHWLVKSCVGPSVPRLHLFLIANFAVSKLATTHYCRFVCRIMIKLCLLLLYSGG